MKTLYLSIIVISLILVGASNSSTAHIEIPQIFTSQSNFTDGDIIPITGYGLPNSTINIFLANNRGNIQNSTQVKSNSTGYFNTSLGIPSHVVGGAWALFATDGEGNFAIQLMVNFHGSSTPPFNFPSGLPPLKQFKLEIKPSDVQCRSDLRLIIKLEDGSPACVKFSTAESLIRHGWASSESGISSDGQKTYIIQDSSTSSTCDTPYVLKTPDISPLFPNDTQITTSYLPVFFMPTNSTGIICVHYTNSNPPSPGYARIFDAQNLSKNADDVSISPSEIQVPTGVTNTTFTIKSGNAGFYGIGFFCGGLPLAVGYDNSSNLVKDDFPWWDKAFHCPAITYSSDITGTRGIGVHYIPEVTYSKIDYNITGTSVSSVHLSPTIQNITFTLNVHTFNDSATFWFDAKDSNYVKFNGDPKLEQEGSDPCTWSFTNNNAVTDENQWYKMVGKVTVTDRPITIPPYTNANYTFSILAKNLDTGYYGFNPAFYGKPIDSTVPPENTGGGSVGSYYPVIMGLDKYLDPSGICSR